MHNHLRLSYCHSCVNICLASQTGILHMFHFIIFLHFMRYLQLFFPSLELNVLCLRLFGQCCISEKVLPSHIILYHLSHFTVFCTFLAVDKQYLMLCSHKLHQLCIVVAILNQDCNVCGDIKGGDDADDCDTVSDTDKDDDDNNCYGSIIAIIMIKICMLWLSMFEYFSCLWFNVEMSLNACSLLKGTLPDLYS